MNDKKKDNFSNHAQSWLTLCFSKASLKQIFKAGGYSLSGFKALLKERAFVQELVLVIVLLPFAFFLTETRVELILLVVSLLLILLVEAINTAIERTIDRVGVEIHPLSKMVKDIGSFCVLFTFAIALVVWLFILVL